MPNHRVHDRCGCGAARGLLEHGAFARPFAFAGTPRNFERDRPFAIEHLAANIELDVPKKSIRATATLTIKRVDESATEIDLDAVGFTITKVSVDGKNAEHRYDGKTLVISVGKNVQTATIAIAYTATPRRGLYFLEPDEHVPDRPKQVWSQ
jgi:aminopeptidase N